MAPALKTFAQTDDMSLTWLVDLGMSSSLELVQSQYTILELTLTSSARATDPGTSVSIALKDATGAIVIPPTIFSPLLIIS